MGDSLVWINGKVTGIEEATVSLEDRGFVFGDGVYEVVRTYGGAPFAMAEHMARFERSAAGIELAPPFGGAEMAGIALDLLHQVDVPEAELYFQLTRGAARRYHPFPEGVPPTLVIWARPLRHTDPALRDQGVTAITHPDERWARCDLKTICLLPNVLAKEHARRAGAFEAILVRDGLVTEGAGSNVAIVKDGTLITPIADRRILPGITRAVVLRLARELGISVVERDVPLNELFEADEVFTLATTAELMPVVSTDNTPIGLGAPGPVMTRLFKALRRLATGSAASH
ncbi:MAG: D-amino acid aminotransferase [Candidatus Sericytochromatia bacterium]